MDTLGLLRIRVRRGYNLIVRDKIASSSDPYVVITTTQQTVYDKDTLGADDPMGTAEIDLKPYLEAARLRKELQELPNGCALKKVQPSGTNDLADESRILWENGRITQDMRLKLRNVESGEVLIQIEWVDIPGCKGLDPDF
ncbi:hypothetical protein V6Z11_D02G169100 [Gossypium hirsutum]|uniref:Protein C2-DOMAIN ABA-RELATED 9 isoform X2 n=1 Tax=Gossypium hirsutum TaxID=3635 RepID=A0A1U8JXS3_GOSHI|nr:protein C2-DOMAIN ABA-RELATED 9 isoform X2 [Gossypium hirsutum]